MGQKANAIGNRLGIIRGWDSNWYGGKNYADKLVEDEKIRKYLMARLLKGGVSKIVIERTLKLITVTIHTARPGIVIGNTGGGITNATYYAKFGLIMNFDAATNKVTSVTNYYGQPSSTGRSAVLDPTGVNSIDPTTKNIRVKFFMDETGIAGHRATFDLTLVYLGAR